MLFSLVTHAQTIPAGENISLDQQLTNIPQPRFQSGIIYERVIPVANLYNFNKVSTLTLQIFLILNRLFLKCVELVITPNLFPLRLLKV